MHDVAYVLLTLLLFALLLGYVAGCAALGGSDASEERAP